MNIALVINESAGGGRAKKYGSAVAQEITKRGLKFTEFREKTASSTIESFEDTHSKDPFTSIISVGGDGLAHLLFPMAIMYSLPIFVAPAGTGNDFARSTGTFGLNASQAVDRFLYDTPQKIDVGQFTHGGQSGIFAQVLSTGFDSIVNERANQYRLIRGKMKYVAAVLQELPFFIPKTYRIAIDGQYVETGAMLVAIANGKSYGGGMNVCPDADLRDGLFDVLILRPVPLAEFIRVFPKVFSGKHVFHPAVEIRRCSSLSIESDAIAYADGERIGELPISIKVLPAAMSTWVK